MENVCIPLYSTCVSGSSDGRLHVIPAPWSALAATPGGGGWPCSTLPRENPNARTTIGGARKGPHLFYFEASHKQLVETLHGNG